MWNFGIPYKLKQWIDVITQPGLAFRYDPAQGYLPVFKDRPTVVILASGSDFITGMNRGRIDMATPYLREALRFIGVTMLSWLVCACFACSASVASSTAIFSRRAVDGCTAA